MNTSIKLNNTVTHVSLTVTNNKSSSKLIQEHAQRRYVDGDDDDECVCKNVASIYITLSL